MDKITEDIRNQILEKVLLIDDRMFEQMFQKIEDQIDDRMFEKMWKKAEELILRQINDQMYEQVKEQVNIIR